ncbi:uncharacterized protein LOC120667259 isoform X2 [Panicum virgatum]|uniref:uncharacterized protein LOC120667259 isoform X2 n=1 Tax=Panicum virgatum TaxID=38727 RepID=UPI0019D5C3AA|nr:uncharacterized protein LOC120667259 isoform X2 [Panicum virgatum]
MGSVTAAVHWMAIPRWIRFIMWLAYLASDAVAIYALATLFNRHKNQDPGGSRMLEVVWAPVLLIHLGGHDGITAYNIEDNELWSRHLLTAVSQVTVAIYVFCKSWRGGDKRLLQAAIVLFVPGVLKCFAKPWALKRASINSLVSLAAAERTAKRDEGQMDPLEEYVKQAKAFVREQKEDEGQMQQEARKASVQEGDHSPSQGSWITNLTRHLTRCLHRIRQKIREQREYEGRMQQEARVFVQEGDHSPSQGSWITNLTRHLQTIRQRIRERQRRRDALHAMQTECDVDLLEEYVKEARAPVEDGDHPPYQQQGADITFFQVRRNIMAREMILHGEAYKLFVDLSSPYPRRLSILKYFWVLSQERAEQAHRSLRKGIASAFLLLYTKLKTAGIPTGGEIENEMGKGSDQVKFLCRQLISLSRLFLPWAAIGLFHNSHREAYNDIDVKITYAIFCCTALLENYSMLPIAWVFQYTKSPMSIATLPARKFCSSWVFQLLENYSVAGLFDSGQWPDMVTQYSLVGYFARNREHSWMMRIVSLFGCKDFLDQCWCIRPCFSSRRITELVLQYLKDGWNQKIQDAASYHSFNCNRGHWALERNQDLDWSIKGPFDESVLIWHIATDFCFFLSPFSDHRCSFAKIPSISSNSKSKGDTPPAEEARSKCGELTACKAVLCRQISNYMMYLLFVNPEMLLPGTRRNLFTTAYKELKDILDDDKPSLFATAYKELKDILKDNNQNMHRRVTTAIKELNDILRDSKRNPLSWSQWKPASVKQEVLMQRVINTMLDNSEKASEEESKRSSEEKPEGGSKGSFIDDAWALAQGLLALGDDDKMWEVIQGVWLEMLCFSASRCRGYLHAKALGSGGEFLTYVWLLMSYMGMETFTERLQREELPPASDARHGMPSPTSEIHTRARAAPSTSQVHHTSASPSTDEICIDMS